MKERETALRLEAQRERERLELELLEQEQEEQRRADEAKRNAEIRRKKAQIADATREAELNAKIAIANRQVFEEEQREQDWVRMTKITL